MSNDFVSAAAPDSKLPAPSAVSSSQPANQGCFDRDAHYPTPTLQTKALSASSAATKAVIVSVSTAMVAAVITIAALYGNFKGARAEDTQVTYNLAVEEVKWDFAQTGRDVCTNTLLGESSSASTFTVNDPTAALIGSKYWRRQFVAYESSDFQTARTIPGAWAHLGSLGPVLRVQAGETLRVRLRNKSRFPASFSVHGLSLSSLTLFDDADTEGVGAGGALPPGPAATGGSKGSGTGATAILQLLGLSTSSSNATLYDTFSGGSRTVSCSSADGAGGRGVCSQAGHSGQVVVHSVHVQPGKTMEYAFAVPREAGPAPGETSSVARLYQSLSFQGHDVGLTGFLVITPHGNPSTTSTSTGTPLSARTRPADVTHEVAQLYSVNNENDSPYLGLNLLEAV